jgi:hypothetical protein
MPNQPDCQLSGSKTSHGILNFVSVFESEDGNTFRKTEKKRKMAKLKLLFINRLQVSVGQPISGRVLCENALMLISI